MLVQILVGKVAVYIAFGDDVAVEVIMKNSRNLSGDIRSPESDCF